MNCFNPMHRLLTCRRLRLFIIYHSAFLILVLAGCGSGDPFKYVQVSGKVTYEDGSLIPIDGMALTFYPQGGALDAKTRPRPGMTTVDRATGEFHSVTSHMPGDGLVPGKYKATLLEGNRMPLPADIVPPEYGDPFKTPLEVDTANVPFHLEIRKP